MGFRGAGSQRYAGRWTKVPSNDPGYAPIALAVTLGSEIENLRFVSVDPSMLPGRIDGQPALVVRGTRWNAPLDSAWLCVRARAAPLPVAAQGRSGVTVW